MILDMFFLMQIAGSSKTQPSSQGSEGLLNPAYPPMLCQCYGLDFLKAADAELHATTLKSGVKGVGMVT